MNKIAMSSILALSLFSTGCVFVPAITSSKGELKIISPPNENEQCRERFVVVSFWDYPTVNDDRGEVVITKVEVTESKLSDVKFPLTGYWMVWTPVFGTQHMAPEPGIMVFREDTLPVWAFGWFGPEFGVRLCCETPKSRHEFVIDLSNAEKRLLDEERKADHQYFFEEFLDKKNDLIRKMNRCENLTSQEKNMVIENITKTAILLGIKEMR